MDDGTRDYLTDVHKSVFLDWTQQHTSDLYSVAERRYDSWMRAVKAQIWDEATSAQAGWEWLAERGREGNMPNPQDTNPCRASEDA